MAWLILVAAGLLEVVWATALKYSDGLSRIRPSIVVVIGALASFLLLAHALRTLPVGTAYAAWVGIGAVGVAAVGVVLFGEALSPLRLGFIALIITGVAGLQFLES